jgi:RNA polymerase sigma-70 factor (ECF subfamily)
MEISDAAAVRQARAGDPDAYRLLVERHSRSLFRLAFRMTGNQQDAEDIVQETFLRAYRQLERFDERAAWSTWLYRIASNCSLDLLRSRQTRKEEAVPVEIPFPAPEPGPERLAFSGQLSEQVTAAMQRLSHFERTAFALRHFEGMCIDEIATVLGVRPNAAKHSVFRAIQKLRRSLEPVVTTIR